MCALQKEGKDHVKDDNPTHYENNSGMSNRIMSRSMFRMNGIRTVCVVLYPFFIQFDIMKKSNNGTKRTTSLFHS